MPKKKHSVVVKRKKRVCGDKASIRTFIDSAIDGEYFLSDTKREYLEDHPAHKTPVRATITVTFEWEE